MALIRRFAAASACAAAFVMAATPASAVELPAAPAASPHGAPSVYESDFAENHGWRRYRGRDRIDAGDVIAGVLILGTIAAVASAAGKRRDRDYDYDRPARYPDDEGRYRSDYGSDGRGLDRAVDMCVDEVERGSDRVGTIDGANRTGEGWTVSGALEDGAGFTCRIDNMGRIRSVDIGSSRTAFEPAGDGQYGDEQYDDDIYARARVAQAGPYAEPGIAPAGELDNRPVWNPEPPPLPAGDDGRYSTSQSPDFAQGS